VFEVHAGAFFFNYDYPSNPNDEPAVGGYQLRWQSTTQVR
jgi:hypothetical protein